MLWSDLPRIIWRESEKLARLFGLTSVEVYFQEKIYTFTRLKGEGVEIVWYGCITRTI